MAALRLPSAVAHEEHLLLEMVLAPTRAGLSLLPSQPYLWVLSFFWVGSFPKKAKCFLASPTPISKKHCWKSTFSRNEAHLPITFVGPSLKNQLYTVAPARRRTHANSGIGVYGATHALYNENVVGSEDDEQKDLFFLTPG
ncbi:hypothetical protein [Hymenobacter cellulosivorans]|uniref:Uncharacterized protein n=1 Tax=Hymenobacter cellulosivorans TaxID=2932249 RepID=A0ABY4F7D0_9BACT|nr:hypothetical protein [Hymenobacter cellulosivorans]UOQ52295.1 hypothetical protein MUN80_21355 [Hymenobacter cellulosivorans]